MAVVPPKMAEISVMAIVVAAGRGLRAGGGRPKQYRHLGGRAVISHALDSFLVHPHVARVLAITHRDDRVLFDHAIIEVRGGKKLLPPVTGGETRQQSVRRGLEALAEHPPDLVLIHDAARPFASADLVTRAIEAGRRTGAAVPGVAVTDTVKVVGQASEVLDTPDRAQLRAIQTPQAFDFPSILDAHRRAAADARLSFPDDGALAEWAGLKVTVFEGERSNVKLTEADDFAEAERRLAGAIPMISRVGTGFDVHATGPGEHLWLGGIRIEADRGLIAHSDGDVVLHALTDALLGAIADGDIGLHFPPSDPRWRGASSDRFLAFACERVARRGGLIDHLDVTVLCETRIGPHREAMRARIAEIAAVPISAVSVKATTTERLGFLGRSEGIAAQAAATVRLPAEPHRV
jgi:2-C-methyl-D-erythritol 4-phosphate cytidylyltransferase / 2-C-methyl-D-erythritol 2,4-cyclodiphosphate synthase